MRITNQYLCRSIPDSVKTEWFDRGTTPAHVGYYERKWWNELRYWDGVYWRRGGIGGDIVFPEDWRGLKEKVDG